MNVATRATRSVPVLILVAGLLATGCTTSGSDEKKDQPGGQQVMTAPPPANQPEGAAKDLKEVKCAADPRTGEWNFTAKLTNSSDKPSEYTVQIHVVKKQGSTVVGSKEIKQKVDPGKTQEIKQDRFAKPEDKPETLQCVPTTTVARG